MTDPFRLLHETTVSDFLNRQTRIPEFRPQHGLDQARKKEVKAGWGEARVQARLGKPVFQEPLPAVTSNTLLPGPRAGRWCSWAHLPATSGEAEPWLKLGGTYGLSTPGCLHWL